MIPFDQVQKRLMTTMVRAAASMVPNRVPSRSSVGARPPAEGEAGRGDDGTEEVEAGALYREQAGTEGAETAGLDEGGDAGHDQGHGDDVAVLSSAGGRGRWR